MYTSSGPILPYKQRFHELHHYHEAQRDQNQSQVQKKHQTADAFDIGTEWIRGGHRFDLGTVTPRAATRFGCAGNTVHTSRTTRGVVVIPMSAVAAEIKIALN